MTRLHLALLAGAALVLSACPDDKKRPLGSTCESDSECAEGACIAGTCLDPEGDEDNDGLINRLEGALGTDPKLADTDGDGINDFDEVVDPADAVDTDGDGKPDAIESSTNDADADCIADQFDPNDSAPETDPAALALKVCDHDGVCGTGGATATCPANGAPVCDYLAVIGYEADEVTCDGKDNDCDGETDEPFKSGGTVSFDGGPNTADQGKVLGDACGAGACAGGAVVCTTSGSALTCSTNDLVGAPACTGDADCNGVVDTVQINDPAAADLAGCTLFYADTDSDTYGSGEGRCLCAASSDYSATNATDCAPDDDDVHPAAAGICGADADCDDQLKDADEGCDDGNTDYGDGCDFCTVIEKPMGAKGAYADQPMVANIDGGGYVLGWNDGDTSEQPNGRVLAFFDDGGKLVKRLEGLGIEERSTYDYRWSLVALRGGDVVYGQWQRQLQTEDYGFYTQRYSSSGEAKGSAVTVVADHAYGSYYNQLVALGPGAYAFFEQGDDGSVNVHWVDADDKVSDTVASINLDNGRVAGFADGTFVATSDIEDTLSWSRLDETAKLIGEPTAIKLDGDDSLRATNVAIQESGAFVIFVMGARYVQDVQTMVVGYQRYTAAGEPDGGLRIVEDQDTDGCPYDVAGTIDSRGNVIAAVWDGECRSPARAWYDLAGGIERLTLQGERYPDAGGGFGLAGGDHPIFIFDWDNGSTGFNEILLRRYDTTGTALYIPDAVR